MSRTKINPTVSRPKSVKSVSVLNKVRQHKASIAFFTQPPSDSWAYINTEHIFTPFNDPHTGQYMVLRPQLVASFSGIYPSFYSSHVIRIRWIKVYSPSELIGEPNLERQYIIDGKTEAETDQIMRTAFYKFADVDQSFWNSCIETAWERSQILGYYKCKAHNYICENLQLDVVQILKCTVKKNKVYVSYLYKKDTGLNSETLKKGATILSQRKLDDDVIDESYFTYVPVISEFWACRKITSQQGYMVFNGYKILLNNKFKGYVVPYFDGYVFVEKSNKLVDPGEDVSPNFEIDWRSYKYEIVDNIYDAIFSIQNAEGRTDVSSTIFQDKARSELNEAAKNKGFGQHIAKQEKKKVRKNTDKFDAFGNPTPSNDVYQFSNLSSPNSEAEDENSDDDDIELDAYSLE